MPIHYQISRACSLYNHYTSPSALRTDSEHAICRKAAARVRMWLSRNATNRVDYYETENGRFVALV